MSINNKKITEFFGETISTYTSDQATEDGILYSVKHQIISYVTTNLMTRHGYFTRENGVDHVNIPNITDLITQAVLIIKRNYLKTKVQDWFYSGLVELPSGNKTKIFIAQNETGRYTIMLPEDY